MNGRRPGVGVRVGVGDERKSGPTQALDLEHRLEAAQPPTDKSRRLPDEGEIPGTAPICPPPKPVDAPDQLGVEADSGGKRKPPAVDAPEGDRPRPPFRQRSRQPPRRLDR